jgi:hypothetical protein
MGTDFNYLYSQDMRQIFDDNCMEANKDLMILLEHTENYMNQDWA